MRNQCRLVLPDWEERHGDRNGDQNDDDPFEKLHSLRAGAIGHLPIDAFQRFELPQDARIPVLKVKTLRGEPVDACEILVAEQLERVRDPFKQQGRVNLQLRHMNRGLVVGTGE